MLSRESGSSCGSSRISNTLSAAATVDCKILAIQQGHLCPNLKHRGFLKIQFFEADEKLKPEFTSVNEDFNFAV